MVDKEEVRDLLERQDISGLHQLVSWVQTFPQYQPEGLTSGDLDYAVHWQKLGDRAPMAALHALPQRCCFRCDHLMFGEGNHGNSDCKHPPLVQELAGLDCSIWDLPTVAQGLRGKRPSLPSKQFSSRVQYWARLTSPLLPLILTLIQECLDQFM